MIDTDYKKKHYGSAKRRFLTPLIARFFTREISNIGPEMGLFLAGKIVALLDAVCPGEERVKPGQLVWLALDKETRAGSKNERLKPVVLTLINEAEAVALAAGTRVVEVRKAAVARMCKEAFVQDAVLSMRDLAMILHSNDSCISVLRIKVEGETGEVLPHTGVLHDMGTCITHKVQIIRKAICEKMDPADVARATRHSQRAVDRYLKAFHRVQTLCDYEKDAEFIAEVTGMTPRLVREYLKIIEEIEDHEN